MIGSSQYQNGLEAVRMGERSEAAAYFRQAAHSDPAMWQAWLWLQWTTDSSNEAAECVTRAQSACHDDPLAQTAVAVLVGMRELSRQVPQLQWIAQCWSEGQTASNQLTDALESNPHTLHDSPAGPSTVTDEPNDGQSPVDLDHCELQEVTNDWEACQQESLVAESCSSFDSAYPVSECSSEAPIFDGPVPDNSCHQDDFTAEALIEDSSPAESCTDEWCAEESYTDATFAEETCIEESFVEEAVVEESFVTDVTAIASTVDDARIEDTFATNVLSDESIVEVTSAKEVVAEESIVSDSIHDQPAASADPVSEDDRADATSSTVEWLSDTEDQISHEVLELCDEVSSTLPQFDETASGPTEHEVQPSQASASTSTPTILVVDDSPTVRKLVTMTLESGGYAVRQAENGIEAMKVLAEISPSMIFLDVNMPRMDGYQLCKLIKRHDKTKLIPVVMLSGKDGMFDKLRGKLVGCNDYISKPFEAADLLRRVQTYVGTLTS